MPGFELPALPLFSHPFLGFEQCAPRDGPRLYRPLFSGFFQLHSLALRFPFRDSNELPGWEEKLVQAN